LNEELTGTIERVTFHNSENGFSVLRVRASGSAGVVTVVGRITAPAEGEGVLARGEWKTDRTHGRQFSAESIVPQQATGRVQIETFLGSGAIRGVGPSTATLIYTKFGEKVFDVLDNEPHRLREISGIGPKRAALIASSWKEQRSIRELMVFLADSGIGLARAGRIYKEFGDDAVKLIKENPYRLAREIRGIGFSTADALALKLGLARDSIHRIRAGVSHALSEGAGNGHCGMPLAELTKFGAELLGVEASLVEHAVELEVEEGRLKRDLLKGDVAIFLPPLYASEKYIAARLKRIVRHAPPWGAIDVDKAIPWVEKKNSITLAPSQREAIATALRSKLTVITGGPGVGKTTIVRSILKILQAKEVKVSLAAPTGRAAKRLSESTGSEAKTIHRLLEFEPKGATFVRDEQNPLACDLLIIDEASMLDVQLMDSVVAALPARAALILVGDVDQLPAVGAGDVLADMISSAVIPVVRLSEVFRQSAQSRIIVNAHAVNQGEMPELSLPEGDSSDFYFVGVRDSLSVPERVVNLVTERIPKRFGFDPLRDIQVLSPMRKGPAGIETLNRELQVALNGRALRSDGTRIERGGAAFAAGDKVMQLVNNYDKDVFNGDVGIVQRVDPEEETMQVDFDGRVVEFERNDLDDVVLAYATTIHKSQGSEYPAVIVILTMGHYVMLQRNLLYTALTRGKRLVVLVGEERAIRQAVSTRSVRKRWTKLREWLVEI
jgi:exodeoxyribonuclease V alpha subunit